MEIPQQLIPLKQYIEEPDTFMLSYIPHEINRLGVNKFLDISIKALDASKVWSDGLRPIQTISYIYVRAITEIVYTILTFVDPLERTKWIDKLLVRHVINIEYEKEYPPVDYDADKKHTVKTKISSKSNTTNKTPRRREKDEPTAAERKLAAHVAKINTLSFNIKH